MAELQPLTPKANAGRSPDTHSPGTKARFERAAVVWVNSSSHLIAESLTVLLTKATCRGLTGSRQPPAATLAVWDLCSLAAPYPPPPPLPTLALVPDTEAAKLAVLSAGYRGYLTGEETSAELRRAFDRVAGGEVWAERTILSRFVKAPQPPSLTPREQQTLHLLAQGLANKEIAEQLEIAEKTVKVYVSELLYKFGVKNRAELVLRYRRERAFTEAMSPYVPNGQTGVGASQ